MNFEPRSHSSSCQGKSRVEGGEWSIHSQAKTHGVVSISKCECHNNWVLIPNKTSCTVYFPCDSPVTGSRNLRVMVWWRDLESVLSADILSHRRKHARPHARASSKSLEPSPHNFQGRTSQWDVLRTRLEAIVS